MPSLIQIIKQAAIEAVENSNPMRLLYGTVTKTSPVEIKIDQKFSVSEDFLVLTRNVMDYEIEVSTKQDISTKNAENHSHGISLQKSKLIVHNKLKAGDRVILMQEQGGQKFIVLDKVGD